MSQALTVKTPIRVKLLEETTLAKNVIIWLEDQHWDIYQEVKLWGGGRADIVAVRDGKLWVIECKTSLTISVLEQAYRWQAHFRSIAIPMGKRDNRRFAYQLAKSLNLGIIVASDKQHIVREDVPAPLMREYNGMAQKYMAKLKPEHKTALAAGSNGGGYVTDYSLTIKRVRHFILDHPGCTLKEIMDALGKQHYASTQSAKACLKGALATWESVWCRTEMDEHTPHYFVRDDFKLL